MTSHSNKTPDFDLKSILIARGASRNPNQYKLHFSEISSEKSVHIRDSLKWSKSF